jgi:hypothetical protein
MHVNDLIASLPKIRTNGTVRPGCTISASRLDGRSFTGTVVRVAAYLATDKVKRPGDTLVTIQREDGSHRSFYLGDLSGWLVAG